MNTLQAAFPLPAIPTDIPDEVWFQPDPAVRLESAQIARQLEYHSVMTTRLVMLGYSADEIYAYLNPAPQHIKAPDDTARGMSDAAKALSAGVASGDTVAIYADYDVDGQTSLAILSKTLEEYGAKLHMGSANAVTGFGLSRKFVEQAAKSGAKWLVTVDCGSTQTEPIKLAQSLGIKVIVIDHHDVDINNPCEHHLNPRLPAALALYEICKAVNDDDEDDKLGVGCMQTIEYKGPFNEQFAKLTERSVGLLKNYFGEDEYQRLSDDIIGHSHPTNTGSMLTWKFAAELHRCHHKVVPGHHWGAPLYLGGLGAIADMAPANDMEVRAFVRVSTNVAKQFENFGNTNVIPMGLQMLALHLGEDPLRPDQLVRTRALINLPKRTPEIAPEDIQRLLRSEDKKLLDKLMPRMVADYERLSAIRRDEMDPMALEQVSEANARGEQTYFAYAVLEGFENYAGYTRMVANTLNRKLGKPAIAFAAKGVDEFGQKLYKFSGANDVVPDAKLGDLIFDEALRKACTIKMEDWVGDIALIPNLGGHTAVVSGVVTEENIPAAKAAFEQWAAAKYERGSWTLVDKKRPRIAQRKINEATLARLEDEAALLYPIAFPLAPALQVSIQGSITNLDIDPETSTWMGVLNIHGGGFRNVKMSESIADLTRAYPDTEFECVIALGRSSDYYISTVTSV